MKVVIEGKEYEATKCTSFEAFPNVVVLDGEYYNLEPVKVYKWPNVVRIPDNSDVVKGEQWFAVLRLQSILTEIALAAVMNDEHGGDCTIEYLPTAGVLRAACYKGLRAGIQIKTKEFAYAVLARYGERLLAAYREVYK